jgi:hypothetical protein
MRALLKGHIRKRSGREVLAVLQEKQNEEVGKQFPSSVNRGSNRAPAQGV